jgi:hypothetical protein
MEFPKFLLQLDKGSYTKEEEREAGWHPSWSGMEKEAQCLRQHIMHQWPGPELTFKVLIPLPCWDVSLEIKYPSSRPPSPWAFRLIPLPQEKETHEKPCSGTQ